MANNDLTLVGFGALIGAFMSMFMFESPVRETIVLFCFLIGLLLIGIDSWSRQT